MMPAGSYYVGDLCYVMNDEEWEQVCDLTINGNTCVSGEFTLPDGRRFAMYNTAWGDGVYTDQTGNEYSVDSGSIGCIKFDDIKTKKYENIESLGTIHEFDSDFDTMYGDGMIHIGHIAIDTDPDYDEEEDEY